MFECKKHKYRVMRMFRNTLENNLKDKKGVGYHVIRLQLQFSWDLKK